MPYLLSAQIVAFLNDIPAIKIHLAEHYKTFQHWVENSFNLSATLQSLLVNNATSGLQDSGIVYIKETFFTVTSIPAFILFTFIYSFLILFYWHIIKSFLFAVFKNTHKGNWML